MGLRQTDESKHGDNYFGYSVAMTDNWAIVGAFNVNKAAAAAAP